jgi:hypothetical protein
MKQQRDTQEQLNHWRKYVVITGLGPGGVQVDAPTRNLQNIKEKHAYQPSKKPSTLYCIHVLPLMNYCEWKQLICKKVYICNLFSALL